jgi:hypothetical protein
MHLGVGPLMSSSLAGHNLVHDFPEAPCSICALIELIVALVSLAILLFPIRLKSLAFKLDVE